MGSEMCIRDRAVLVRDHVRGRDAGGGRLQVAWDDHALLRVGVAREDGVGLLAAVSAPTALAVRPAADCGLPLAAIVRGHSFECFTHPARIKPDACAHVA